MTTPAFVATPPWPPSLFDYVSFSAFAPAPWPVRPHLRPRPLSKQDRALLCEGGKWRRVELEIAAAVYWEGKA